jgi:hypothetical protein
LGEFTTLKNSVKNVWDYLIPNLMLTDDLNLIIIYHNGAHPPRSEWNPSGGDIMFTGKDTSN